MLTIVCPSCTASFNAPQNAIPAAGRTLRCSACGHQWHFTPVADLNDMIKHVAENGLDSLPPAPVPESFAVDVPASSFADVLAQTTPSDDPPPFFKPRPVTPPPPPAKRRPWVTGRGAVQGYAAALVVLALVMGAMIPMQKLITSIWPQAQAVYDLVGMPMVYGAPNLVFEDLRADFQKGQYTLTGFLHNQDSLQQLVPPIRVGVMGAGDTPMTVWVFRADARYLDPGARVPITHVRPFDQPDNVHRLVFSFIDEPG